MYAYFAFHFKQTKTKYASPRYRVLLFFISPAFSDNDSFEPACLNPCLTPKLQCTYRWRRPSHHSGCMGRFADGQLIGVSPPSQRCRWLPPAMQIQINAGVKRTPDRNISARYILLPLVTTLTPEPGKAYTISSTTNTKDETYFLILQKALKLHSYLLTNDLDGNTETKVIYHKWRCRIRQ